MCSSIHECKAADLLNSVRDSERSQKGDGQIVLTGRRLKHPEVPHCSFVEKTSVKQDPKPYVCSNFQMSSLHLGQMDLPGRGFRWPRVVLTWVQLT